MRLLSRSWTSCTAAVSNSCLDERREALLLDARLMPLKTGIRSRSAVYTAMVQAINHVAADAKVELANVRVWVDFCSIPQENRSSSGLPSRRCPSSRAADYFVAGCRRGIDSSTRVEESCLTSTRVDERCLAPKTESVP